MKQPSLEGKVALVTGGGSGLGEAAAIALADAGVIVGVLGRTEESVEKVVTQIIADGGRAVSLVADVSNSAELKCAVEKLVAEHDRLDIVFANAGINGVWAPLSKLTEEEWEETLRINLTGTFLALKHTEPHLKKRGGSIIVTSSVNGTRMFSNTGATAYACSKAAQVAMVKMLALELAQDRIRVNAICPGAIESEIEDSTERRDLEGIRPPIEFPEGTIPLKKGKPGKAEEVAALVCFLASDAASHISGTEIFIDGAQSLLQG